MIIDFHTHVFPDKIAAGAIASLEERAKLKAGTDGTVNGLLASMDISGVDISVVLPVVTSVRQFDSINRFAAENQSKRLVFFGGIHPDCDNPEEKIDALSRAGFIGIKLHPDYQGTFITDKKYIRIIRAALERGMYITIHAGVDIGLPEPVHCPPELSAKMLEAVKDLNTGEPHIILAHMGGYAMSDAVLEHLCGKNVLFDTGFNIDREDREVMKKIINTHGAENILFATDSPWNTPSSCLDALEKLDLTSEQRDLILFKNALRIINV
ncbi:MAG: amidohydrolase family protein [Clostridia bacterium]|nr:amidohydrolase family protein [Clostridia bacterium]